MKKIALKFVFLGIAFFAIGLNLHYYWDDLWTVWARHYIKDQDIVISLTTTPHRIRLLEDVMSCLAAQNAPIRQIFVNIPHVFKRDNLTYTIPDWLDVYPNVTILRTEDYGPATKLLGTLKHAPLKDDTIIITVDDDTCYPENMALRLAARAKMYSNRAIGVSGAILDFEMNKEGGIIKIMQDKIFVPVLEGFGGVAYRAKFFDDSIYTIKDAPDFCYNSDDLFISFQLAKNGVARQTLHNKYLKTYNIMQQQFGYDSDALFKIGEKQNKTQASRYEQCLNYLTAQHPEVEFSNNGIKCLNNKRSVCTKVIFEART